MDYKSVFTNLCLELQQNRSWIKGLGKNPQKSELIHWRQCLLSGGTEACSLGLRETPACIHIIQHLSQPRVACWHGFRKNSQKNGMRVYDAVRQAVKKKIACIHGLRSKACKHGPLVHTCVLSCYHYKRIRSNDISVWKPLWWKATSYYSRPRVAIFHVIIFCYETMSNRRISNWPSPRTSALKPRLSVSSHNTEAR